MIPHWVSYYIGIPFVDFGRDSNGVDCWGLVRLVLIEQFGIDMPSYTDGYGSALDRASVGKHIADTVNDPIWVDVPSGKEKIGDVVVTKINGLPSHVGIVVDKGQFLHIQPKTNSVIESYQSPKWKNVIVGFYRPAPRIPA